MEWLYNMKYGSSPAAVKAKDKATADKIMHQLTRQHSGATFEYVGCRPDQMHKLPNYGAIKEKDEYKY